MVDRHFFYLRSGIIMVLSVNHMLVFSKFLLQNVNRFDIISICFCLEFTNIERLLTFST